VEKRFALFLALSLGILITYSAVMRLVAPPQEIVERIEDADGDKKVEEQPAEEPSGDPAERTETTQPAEDPTPNQPATDPVATEPPAQQQWASFGSYARGSGQGLLVTFNNRAAAMERVELTARNDKGQLRYRQLGDNSGYLGYMALTPHDENGCVVNVVGAGTPAALAGLQKGDVLTKVADVSVTAPAVLADYLRQTKPGDPVNLTLARNGAAISVTATLDVWPLQLLQPEVWSGDLIGVDPPSFLLSVVENRGEKSIDIDVDSANLWEVELATDNVVEFRLPLRAEQLSELGLSGALELVKRYRLGAAGDLESDEAAMPFHLGLELEVHNPAEEARRLQYRLTGPNGLPLEGWWHSMKIHPKMFYGAGARDVIYKTNGRRFMVGCPALYKLAKKQPNDRAEPLFAEGETVVNYLAVDTQYFAAVLIPQAAEGAEDPFFERAEAFAFGDIAMQPKGRSRTTNVSFDLLSEPFQLQPGDSFKQSFRLFLGPKDPTVLRAYELDDVLYYGWFGGISKVLAAILHFFYDRVGNYGIAIIMLTVLVRGCMFPISRKAAKNAAMMQELAPEMRKLTEKYKNDMEKRAKAQQDLFRSHNYNPFGGCWLMFLQLPIFLGLYRCIAVDIELRQAPLIPGMSWCSNLAGPDQLVFWKDFVPFGLASESGMFGPYLNVLPLVTVAFFLMHQKLFTPPATDDQSRMQLQMMKYMTLFMGILFFKVASGLCLYFVASSMWGIAERKLVPKPKVTLSKGTGGSDPPARGGGGRGGGGGGKKPTSPGSNGAEKKAARKKRNKRR
jgi:YidC/Oxa1 family membrane protein insertase